MPLQTASGQGTEWLMSITAGLTATQATLELAKLLMDRLNGPNVDVHEVRSQVQEMLMHVVNAQVALGEARGEISELRRQLDERLALKALNDDMEYVQSGGFYARKSEQLSIPYCHVCWKKDNITIPLERTASPGYLRCAVHSTTYETDEYREHLKGIKTGEPRRRRR